MVFEIPYNPPLAACNGCEQGKNLPPSDLLLGRAEELAHLASWSWSVSDGQVTWSKGLCQILGIESRSVSMAYRAALNAIHPSDQRNFKRYLLAAVTNTKSGCDENRVVREDGTERVLKTLHIEVKRNWKGEPIRITCLLQDITEAKEAERSIQRSIKEKEVLLQEVHHRVKNNMQVISSLIRMQFNEVKAPELKNVFQDLADRIQSMALVHERLYRSANFSSINLADYTQNLLKHLMSLYSSCCASLSIQKNLTPIFLGVDQAIPCGLILNELIVNAITHGLKDVPQPELEISLHLEAGAQVQIVVCDNGQGILESNESKSGGLGLKLVKMLSRQLDGEFVVANVDGKTRSLVSFPLRGFDKGGTVE
jgi:two-component system response regulator